MDLIYKFNIQSPRHLTLVSLNEFVFWSVHWKKNLFWEVWYHWTPELLFSSLCLNCAFLFKPENLNYYLYHCAQTDFLFKPKSCVLWEVWYRWTAELLFRSLCPNCAFLFKPEHLNYNSYHCAQTVTFFPPKSCVLLLFSDSSPVAWWRLPPSVHPVWTASQ